MQKPIRNDDFAKCARQRYMPETGIACNICFGWIYPDEKVSWDKRGEICHEECLHQLEEDDG